MKNAYPEYYQTEGVLVCGGVQSNVVAKLYPKLFCGGFWLTDLALVKLVTEERATLHTESGERLRLLDVHRCPGQHLTSTDGFHIEFDYEPIASREPVSA